MDFDKKLQKQKSEISKLKKENAQLRKLIKKYELQIQEYSDTVNIEEHPREEVSQPKGLKKPKNFKEMEND